MEVYLHCYTSAGINKLFTMLCIANKHWEATTVPIQGETRGPCLFEHQQLALWKNALIHLVPQPETAGGFSRQTLPNSSISLLHPSSSVEHTTFLHIHLHNRNQILEADTLHFSDIRVNRHNNQGRILVIKWIQINSLNFYLLLCKSWGNVYEMTPEIYKKKT